jgi:hypothetical protein
MKTVKVILRQDMDALGEAGEVVAVRGCTRSGATSQSRA